MQIEDLRNSAWRSNSRLRFVMARGEVMAEEYEPVVKEIIRQVVEGVNSQIKLFNRVSRWRKGITLLAYLYGYAIGYSFFRKSQIWG